MRRAGSQQQSALRACSALICAALLVAWTIVACAARPQEPRAAESVVSTGSAAAAVPDATAASKSTAVASAGAVVPSLPATATATATAPPSRILDFEIVVGKVVAKHIATTHSKSGTTRWQIAIVAIEEYLHGARDDVRTEMRDSFPITASEVEGPGSRIASPEDFFVSDLKVGDERIFSVQLPRVVRREVGAQMSILYDEPVPAPLAKYRNYQARTVAVQPLASRDVLLAEIDAHRAAHPVREDYTHVSKVMLSPTSADVQNELERVVRGTGKRCVEQTTGAPSNRLSGSVSLSLVNGVVKGTQVSDRDWPESLRQCFVQGLDGQVIGEEKWPTTRAKFDVEFGKKSLR